MKYWWIVFLISFRSIINAQNVQQDSLKVLSYKDYIIYVLNEHPLAKTANLKERLAKAELLAAKGFFDPVIKSSYDKKEFDNKEYYTIFSNKLIVPTPIGVDVVGGYDLNDGIFLNPENTITNKGLWSVGLEVDVLQGLFTNQRRTAVQQAKAFQDIAKSQQQQMLNELLYTTASAYNEWQQYHRTYLVIKKNVELGNIYKQATINSFISGEKTAIDTLEASINLENLRVKLFDYQQLLVEKQQKLENHLWFNNIPALLADRVLPQNDLVAFPNIGNETVLTNPEITEKIAKKEQITFKERLAREKLKPKLKVKYNQLLATSPKTLNPIYEQNNYKWGASLSFPIFIRNERGNLAKVRNQLEAIDYEIAFKQQSIDNKIDINQNKQSILQSQINILKQNVIGYQKLLKAENIKLKYGESSLFLINKRQEKLIEAEMKLIKSQHDLVNTQLVYLLLINQILP